MGRRPSFVIMFALFALAACATTPTLGQENRIEPREAILAAADAAPRSVPGIFAMRVAATGRVGGRVYLNSEADYRDQRNLSIAIAPAAARDLARRHGAEPDVFFRGQGDRGAGPGAADPDRLPERPAPADRPLLLPDPRRGGRRRPDPHRRLMPGRQAGAAPPASAMVRLLARSLALRTVAKPCSIARRTSSWAST